LHRQAQVFAECRVRSGIRRPGQGSACHSASCPSYAKASSPDGTFFCPTDWISQHL